MHLIYSGLSAQAMADMVMGVYSVITVVFLIACFFFGAYGLYGVIRLKKEKYLIPHRLMYPNYCPNDECLEPVDYMDFIIPRLSILSVVMLLSGTMLLLCLLVDALGTLWVLLGLYIVPLAVYLWYSMSLKRAAKKYW